MADVLEVVDADASAWLAQQDAGRSLGSGDYLPTPAAQPAPPLPGVMHLLLGCSVARDARLRVAAPDLILNRARGGNTWQRVAARLEDDLGAWRRAAASLGMTRGRVIIWLSGNEAYDRQTGANRLAGVPRGDLEDAIRAVLTAVRAVSTPVLLGALPRFFMDRLLPWEHTAAYLPDRKVCEVADADEFISMGKSLTKKLGKRHVVVDDCARWFGDDGLHLSPAGYAKVSLVKKLPQWFWMD